MVARAIWSEDVTFFAHYEREMQDTAPGLEKRDAAPKREMRQADVELERWRRS